MLFGGKGVLEGGGAVTVTVGVIAVGVGVGLGEGAGVVAVRVGESVLVAEMVSSGRGETGAGVLPHPASSAMPRPMAQQSQSCCLRWFAIFFVALFIPNVSA